MLLTEIGDLIKRKVYSWLEKEGVHDIPVTVEIPSNPAFGDLVLSITFKLAKKLGRSPAKIADDIVKFLENIPFLDHIEIAGGGYINIFLNREKYYDSFINLVFKKDVDFARVNLGGGLIRLEYTSVNPNKALHIGHARNVVLGAALYRLLKYVGYDVDLLNYIDDTGTQMADVILGFLYLGYDATYAEGRFDQYCGDAVYTAAHEKIESSEELKKKRKNILKLIEEGGNVVSSFTRMIAEKVLREQLRTCWRLGAYYNKLIWESDIVWSGMHKKGLEEVRRSRIVKYISSGKYAGCWVAKVSEDEDVNPEVDDVLVRSNGTLTYVGKDAVFALWKLGLLKHPLPFSEFVIQPDDSKIYSSSWPKGELIELEECEKSINIIGIEQAKSQDIIKKIIKNLYGDEWGSRYIHYYYNLVWLSKRTAEKYLGVKVDSKALKMSGRKGYYINVDNLLDLMKNKILEIIYKNNPGLDAYKAGEIAEKIAVASLKYILLSVDRDKVVVFDLDDALDVAKESGVYILYSFARANSILRNAESEGYYPSENLIYEGLNEYDFKLMRYLTITPVVILDSAESLEVKNVVHYMFRLSQLFNEFYEKNPVIKAEENLRESRLAIVKTYVIVMRLLGELVGISLVDKM